MCIVWVECGRKLGKFCFTLVPTTMPVRSMMWTTTVGFAPFTTAGRFACFAAALGRGRFSRFGGATFTFSCGWGCWCSRSCTSGRCLIRYHLRRSLFFQVFNYTDRNSDARNEKNPKHHCKPWIPSNIVKLTPAKVQQL